MSRTPHPYYRKGTDSWYMQYKGKQIRLGKSESEAWRRYHEIIEGRGTPTVNEVLGKYLDWCQRNRELSTYGFYRVHLLPFQKHIGPIMTMAEFRPWEVTKWLQKFPNASTTYQHNIVRSIKRALNWAAKEGLIAPSPVARMDAPTPTSRDTVIDQKQFDELLGHVKDSFADFLHVLWSTGARPKELRIAEARHLEAGRLVFERLESKGKQRRRVIHLPPDALAIVQRLAKQFPTGPLFRNQRGEGWTKSAVSQRFQRLCKRVDFDCTAYAIRHSWATRQLREGKLTDTQVARLMGHTSTRMLSVYEHLSDDDLQRALRLVV